MAARRYKLKQILGILGGQILAITLMLYGASLAVDAGQASALDAMATSSSAPASGQTDCEVVEDESDEDNAKQRNASALDLKIDFSLSAPWG